MVGVLFVRTGDAARCRREWCWRRYPSLCEG